jgi:hypothetical protein
MKTMKNQCKSCGGKFGLVRHHHWHQAFCSKRCLARFDEDMRRKVLAAREHFGLTASAMDTHLAPARVAKIK